MTLVEVDVRARWFDQIAKVLPAILTDLSDMKRWLVRGQDQSELLKRLDGDVLSETLILGLRTIAPERRAQALAHSVVPLLGELFRAKPPRLYGTYDRLREALDSLKIDHASLSTTLIDLRSAALSEAFKDKDLPKMIGPSAKSWIGPK